VHIDGAASFVGSLRRRVFPAAVSRLRRGLGRERSTAFAVVALIALAIQSFVLFLALFEPGLPYSVSRPPGVSLDTSANARLVENVTAGRLSYGNRVEVIPNGEAFYPAELQAIAGARDSIHLEAYIFSKGKVAQRFADALAERARAGVEVRLVLDALGSHSMSEAYLRDLRQAGGRVAWYHPVRWQTIARYNNRTHRELLVIDGRRGFVGGAGVADHWYEQQGKEPRWRDTMFRVEGPAVLGLQSTFVENWLESAGELLASGRYFPDPEARGASTAMVVDSSPSAGRSTRARALFQLLLASARESIDITTPYFLPDASLRDELTRAVKSRGVRVRILTPGKHSDHEVTRSSSRRLYGDLIRAGAAIYEYGAGMIHAKTLVVDRLWSAVGSTNLDSRSFGLNDEVNLVTRDRDFAERLTQVFEEDLARSRVVSYEEWRNRPDIERLKEWIGALIERQQ
jgi:cardiolipin synthase